jgi:hypothetical protein
VRRQLDVLLFKADPEDGPPVFVVVTERSVPTFIALGWYRLASERDIRYADIEDVRREDERGWR